jgi:hypothetical protein
MSLHFMEQLAREWALTYVHGLRESHPLRLVSKAIKDHSITNYSYEEGYKGENGMILIDKNNKPPLSLQETRGGLSIKR